MLIEQIRLVCVPVRVHRPVCVGMGVLMTDVVMDMGGMRMRMRQLTVAVLMLVRIVVLMLIRQRRLLGRTVANTARSPLHEWPVRIRPRRTTTFGKYSRGDDRGTAYFAQCASAITAQYRHESVGIFTSPPMLSPALHADQAQPSVENMRSAPDPLAVGAYTVQGETCGVR